VVADASVTHHDRVMRSHELTIGRTFGLSFDHGEDLFGSLAEFCRANNVRQGYIPFFLAGFSALRIVGTCERLEDPVAPLRSAVYLTNVEAHGGGTIAYDPVRNAIAPHIHVSAGLKEHSATGHTSHLLEATVQVLTEMVVVEVVHPDLRRVSDAARYHVPLLTFSGP
jgi:predicted DNA-binding protein with PD1-like motif